MYKEFHKKCIVGSFAPYISTVQRALCRGWSAVHSGLRWRVRVALHHRAGSLSQLWLRLSLPRHVTFLNVLWKCVIKKCMSLINLQIKCAPLFHEVVVTFKESFVLAEIQDTNFNFCLYNQRYPTVQCAVPVPKAAELAPLRNHCPVSATLGHRQASGLGDRKKTGKHQTW